MTCWRPTSARCWPLWVDSVTLALTASERLIGSRPQSWCVCCALLVGPAVGGGPLLLSCGEWAVHPLPALRARCTPMITLHLPPVRMTTSEQLYKALPKIYSVCEISVSLCLLLNDCIISYVVFRNSAYVYEPYGTHACRNLFFLALWNVIFWCLPHNNSSEQTIWNIYVKHWL